MTVPLYKLRLSVGNIEGKIFNSGRLKILFDLEMNFTFHNPISDYLVSIFDQNILNLDQIE